MKAITVLFVLLGLAAFSSCTVLTVIQAKPNLSTLVSLINASGLADEIATKTPITLFAPNNAAFDKLDNATLDQIIANNSLADALLYHVINGRLPTSQFQNDVLINTLDPRGNQVRTNVYKQMSTTVYTVNGAKVVEPNVESTNGLIQVIDEVLLPPTETITGSLSSNASFSILFSLLTAAGFQDAFNGSFTVFAPTNDAFNAAFTPEALEMLMSENFTGNSRALLIKLLSYHVVPGTWFSAGFYNNLKLPTLLGTNLTINVDNEGIAVNGYANVTKADWIQINGVIHAVDAVIFPKFFIYEINELEALTTLNAALVAAGLLDSVNKTGTFNWTEFAPTNEAFAAIGITSEEDINITSIIEGNYTLVDILNYHFIKRAWYTAQLKNNQLLTTVLGPKIRVNVYNVSMETNNTNVSEVVKVYTANCARLVVKDVPASNGVVHIIDEVLIPPSMDIREAVGQMSELSSLNALLGSLNTTILQPDGSYTLFAPSNTAFAALDPSIRNQLETNATLLEEVILYHILKGVWCSSGFSNNQTIQTLEGRSVFIRVQEETISVNGAAITNADLVETNGVIQIINRVLMPGEDSGPLPPTPGSTGSTGSTGTPVNTSDSSVLTSGLFLTVLALITALRFY